MTKSYKPQSTDRKHPYRIPGDPGVGGLLSDPLAPSDRHDEPDPSAGPPTPDPAPPRQHGDWSPTRKAQGRMTAVS